MEWYRLDQGWRWYGVASTGSGLEMVWSSIDWIRDGDGMEWHRLDQGWRWYGVVSTGSGMETTKRAVVNTALDFFKI
jgi:hypothetical protein